MSVVYVGVDTGSRTCHVTAMDHDGNVVADQNVETGEKNLINAVTAIEGELLVNLESGELAWWIRGILKQRGMKVVVSDAKRNAWIAKDPQKGDPVDARKLADLARMNQVREVYYPEEDHKAIFKQIVQHYDDSVEEMIRLKQKIKARFRMQGVIRKTGSVFKEAGRIKAMSEVRFRATRIAIGHLYETLEAATERVKKAKRLMFQEGRRYREIGWFKEVPGTGPISACRFYGYVQTPHRFKRRESLWRLGGLGVMNRTSDGKPIGRQRLDRSGNGRLKGVSHTVFLGAMRRRGDNAFKRTYQATLKRTHNQTHARLTTQRKIMTTLWTMWKKGERYQDHKG